MKIRKRLLAAILTLVLILGMPIGAFADNENPQLPTQGESNNQPPAGPPYTITLSAGRGTMNDQNRITMQTDENGRLDSLPDVEHPDRQFDGWYIINPPDMGDLFIHWVITIDMLERVKAGPDGTVFTGDTEIYAIYNISEMPGFEGYKCLGDGEAIEFDTQEDYLYFDANGGRVSSAKVPLTQKGFAKEWPDTPTHDSTNAIFLGWYTEPEGGSKVERVWLFPKGVRLFAHWDLSQVPPPAPKHTVTLTSNPDGACSFEGAGDYDEGTEATVKAAHTVGYVFDGWYDEAGNKVSDGVREGMSSTYAYTFTVSEDVKLTAKFKTLTSLSYEVSPIGNKIFAPDEWFSIRYSLMDSQDRLLRSEFDKITLSLNGKSIGENQSERSAFMVKGSELNLGSNELTLVYPGNDVYHRASGIIKVDIVNKLQPRLVDFEPTYAPLNTPFTISGRLLDENNNPVIGEHMTLSIQLSENSAGYAVFAWITTDDEGRFSCTCDKKLPDSPGKRKIHIYTDGNDKYKYYEAYPEVQFTDKEIYSITSNVEPKEGGMVTLSKSSTIAGDEVTIGVTPNKGYVFDSLACPVDIIPLGGGSPVTTWKFTMPESDVNISAFFKKTTETEEGEDPVEPVEPVELWNVKLDMNGGTIWEAETDTIKSSISMECPSGYEQEVPTIEWMKEALEEGTWITGPAECEYIGAEITDKNGKAIYQPGDIYKVYSDALIKVLWKPTKEENTSPGKSYISYDLNGGMLNGKTGKVVIEGENGTIIILPEPTREGYIFDYWEGSRYNAGDEYVINGDHTLTAHWKKASAAPGEDSETDNEEDHGDTTPKNDGTAPAESMPKSSDASNANKTAPNTGDESNLPLWIALALASMIGCRITAKKVRR